MRPRDDIRALAGLASRQNGNVTHHQLLDAGLSSEQIKRLRRAGWLIPRHTGVYAVGYVPDARESAWHAAVLALGAGAVLSYASAIALWGMGRATAIIEVTVPTTAGHVKRDGIVVHRQRLPPEHVTVYRGIPVTIPILTLLDYAAVAPLNALFRAFEQAQVHLHIPPAPIAAEVGEWTPDFYWPEWGLIVETDSVAFHSTAWEQQRDALKDDAMRALGLDVLRLRWAEVVGRPAETARRIHECQLKVA
jgi:hypothetical protein